MSDYRRFLGQREEHVVPWAAGRYVFAAKRRFSLASPPPQAGWWRVVVKSGRAEVAGPADEAPDLSGLPVIVGHRYDRQLVGDDGCPRDLLLSPAHEHQRFAPLRARRWHEGSFLLDDEPFEGDSEEATRHAFEDRASLAERKGVPASLRAAFAYATLAREAIQLGAAWHPLEFLSRVPGIAEGGPAEARRLLVERWARWQAELARSGHEAEPRTWREARARARTRRARPLEQRVARVLEGCGAQLLDVRLLRDEGQALAEVRYRFLHGRFSAIVDANTLNVVDAGVCLSGADRELSLDSLPGVIREGSRTGRLVVMREA